LFDGHFPDAGNADKFSYFDIINNRFAD
jgi:hypothetical protein